MNRSTRVSLVIGVFAAAVAAALYLKSHPDAVSRLSQGGRPDAATAPARDAAAGNGPSASAAGPGGAAPARPGGRAGGAPVPVKVVQLKATRVPIEVKLVGRAEAASTVALRSRIDGQILEVRFAAGQDVRKGQLLVLLDDRVQTAQLAQARANLARDEANLRKAQADLKRSEELLGKGFVSGAQLDAARAAMASQQAIVEADRAAVQLAATQLGFARILAPIDGVAGNVLAYPGNIVKANDTQLVVINQIQPMKVQFSVPEARILELRRDGLPLERLPVSAGVPGDTRAPLQGRIDFIDNAVDVSTGTIALKAVFDNADRRLTPGQFVELAVTLREIPDALTLPAEALQTGPMGSFVYVAKDDGTVEVRRIQSISGNGTDLIVTAGLKVGERIVVDGQLRLTPGARYQDVGAGPRGAPAGRAAAPDARRAAVQP
ncbi:MAG: efflux RND transporter periplasmic adaptor subunit [Lautropia sp.]